MSEPTQDVFSNRMYKIALTLAVSLFLLVLTTTILILILVNAREHKRQNALETTLTAMVKNTLEITPTPAPEVTYGAFPFKLDRSPIYSAGADCQEQTLAGQVLDQEGKPTDDFTVQVWGDYLTLKTLSTGEIAGQQPGRWAIRLESVANRRLWVQLTTRDRYLSAPVEIVLDAGRCDQNEIEIVFKQVRALD